MTSDAGAGTDFGAGTAGCWGVVQPPSISNVITHPVTRVIVCLCLVRNSQRVRIGEKANNGKLFFGDEKKTPGQLLRGRLNPLSVQLKTRRYRNRECFELAVMLIYGGPNMGY